MLVYTDQLISLISDQLYVRVIYNCQTKYSIIFDIIPNIHTLLLQGVLSSNRQLINKIEFIKMASTLRLQALQLAVPFTSKTVKSYINVCIGLFRHHEFSSQYFNYRLMTIARNSFIIIFKLFNNILKFIFIHL